MGKSSLLDRVAVTSQRAPIPENSGDMKEPHRGHQHLKIYEKGKGKRRGKRSVMIIGNLNQT